MYTCPLGSIIVPHLSTLGTDRCSHQPDTSRPPPSHPPLHPPILFTIRYRGAVSLKTIKDVSFVGPDQSMVAAGSDDGRLFIWERYTGGWWCRG